MSLVPVPGFPRYFVTADGEVWSTARSREPRRLKPCRDSDGYLFVHLCRDNKAFMKSIHHIVLETFVGLRPDGMITRHLDGNQLNNRLNNLAWGTQLENMVDREMHGHTLYGEQNPSVKLNPLQVRIIRRLRGVLSSYRIADIFGVSAVTIQNIYRGHTWGQVK